MGGVRAGHRLAGEVGSWKDLSIGSSADLVGGSDFLSALVRSGNGSDPTRSST